MARKKKACSDSNGRQANESSIPKWAQKTCDRLTRADPNLTRLDLPPQNGLDDTTVEAVAAALQGNRTVRDLVLDGSRVSSRGLVLLLEAAPSSLEGLEISDAAVLGQHDGAAALKKFLRTAKALQLLSLVRNHIASPELIDGLRHASALKLLFFDRNDIGSQGAKALAAVIQTSPSLEELGLSHNAIGDEGVVCIADGLLQNSALVRLNLADNSVGDEGAKAIGSMLQCNQTLKKLVLADNQIGSKGGLAIANGLSQGNGSLQRLDLSGNRIGEEGVSALRAVQKSNRVPKDLALCGNQIARIIFPTEEFVNHS